VTLALGLVIAQVPKIPKAVKSRELNRFVSFDGFKPQLLAFPLLPSFRIPQGMAR
jgi:hypothetical protein